jgi:hypothetical protein
MFELGERGAERCSRRDLEATADRGFRSRAGNRMIYGQGVLGRLFGPGIFVSLNRRVSVFNFSPSRIYLTIYLTLCSGLHAPGTNAQPPCQASPYSLPHCPSSR